MFSLVGESPQGADAGARMMSNIDNALEARHEARGPIPVLAGRVGRKERIAPGDALKTAGKNQRSGKPDVR